MTHEVRAWLAAAALLAGVVGGAAAQPAPAPAPGQPTPAPRATAAVAADATEPGPWELLAPIADPSFAPPAEAPFEDGNGPLLAGDPFLDPARLPAPGFFATVETTILAPSFNNRLSGPVTVPGVGSIVVALPTASMPWTAAPEFRVGYTLPQGFGSFALTYRFLTDQGSSPTPWIASTGAPDVRALLNLPGGVPPFLPTGPGTLTSRLNVNIIGIDYSTRQFSVAPKWDVRATAGAWIVTNYFDSQVRGSLLEERVSSNEVAAGPHVGMELWRWLSPQPGHGLALYGKAETAVTFGRVQQNFESNILGAGGMPIAGGAHKYTVDPLAVPGSGASQVLPIMRVQAGVTWAPDWADRRLRFSGGYAFEGWWWVGRLPGPIGNSYRLGSGSTMTLNGVFMRAEWKY